MGLRFETLTICYSFVDAGANEGRRIGVGPPTRPCGETDSMQFIAYVPQNSLLSSLKASSMDCFFTREFYESGADRNRYKIVHLKDGFTIEAAQRQATWMAEMSVGIVNTKRGFAIRVFFVFFVYKEQTSATMQTGVLPCRQG